MARPLRQRHGTRPPIERHPHLVELLGDDHTGGHRLPQVHVPRPLSSIFRHFQEPRSLQLVHHPGEFVSGLYLQMIDISCNWPPNIATFVQYLYQTKTGYLYLFAYQPLNFR